MASITSSSGSVGPTQTPAGLPPLGSVVNAARRDSLPPATSSMAPVWAAEEAASGRPDHGGPTRRRPDATGHLDSVHDRRWPPNRRRPARRVPRRGGLRVRLLGP